MVMMTMTISSKKDKYGGATNRGKSHIKTGIPNQDAFVMRKHDYGYVFSVADGVGSHKFSQIGSKAIVDSVDETFTKFEEGQIERKNITTTIFQSFREKVPVEYRESASTTCIFAAILKKHGVFLGMIGDGICAIKINQNEFRLDAKEEAFSNIVVAANPSKEMPMWKTKHFDLEQNDTISLLLATDGVSGDIIPGKEFECLTYFETKVCKAPRILRNFRIKTEIKNWGPAGSLDDKTMIVFSRK